MIRVDIVIKKILGLFGAVLVAVTLSACSSKSPEDVAISFVEASYKGNADKMMDMIYLPADKQDQPGTKDMLSGKLKQAAAKSKENADRKGGVKDITVQESKIDEANGLGQVIVNIDFKNEGSQSETDRVKLIQNDGQWKISL